MLDVQDIHVYLGDSHILQGVSLTVSAGEIVCLLGRNGAGKTTTMRSIMGYAPPAKGAICLDGHGIASRPVYENVRRGMGYVPEDRRIFADLTVTENLDIARLPARDGQSVWNAARVFDTFPLLADLRHRQGGELSGGEQQMLSIARAMMGNPRLLLLDEPCEGLAPLIVEALGAVILDLKADIPVLLTEQNARFAFNVSNRGYIIDKGRVCHAGTSDELMRDQEIQNRYLAL